LKMWFVNLELLETWFWCLKASIVNLRYKEVV
jgi:hypothetical protein